MGGRVLAVVTVTVAVGASAAADSAAAASTGIGFARVARGALSSGEGPVIAGDEVLIGRTRDRRGVVEAVSFDGSSRRVLRVQDAGEVVNRLAGSDQAIAAATATFTFDAASSGIEAGFGPPAGPLRPFPFRPDDVGVAGSLVVATRYGRSVAKIWDINAPEAPPRDVELPRNPIVEGVAGHFIAPCRPGTAAR
jgi:hypothetical protein